MSSFSTFVGWLLSLRKTSEVSGKTSQVCQADLFPFPRNADTMSQPVKAWKKRIPWLFSGLRDVASWCTGIHFRKRPCPKANHNSWSPTSFKLENKATAKTSTSVSLAFIMMVLKPLSTASLAWRNILVSASSWLQGEMLDRLTSMWLLFASGPFVMMTLLSKLCSTTLSARKLKSSDLFVEWRRKFLQFLGNFPVSVTRRLSPWPR